MKFDLGAGLPELMKVRELNEKRTEYLRGLREQLADLQQKEVIQRVLKESAAEVADEILAEVQAVDEGRLAPGQRRFSDPDNAGFRNEFLLRRVDDAAKRHGIRLTPDYIEDARNENYLA